MKSGFPISAAFLLSLSAAPPAMAAIYQYDGDLAPHQGAYGDWFTTIGGGPHSPYFTGTTWSSDGGILTMQTILPGYGVWFGRHTSTYGDPAGFNLGSALDGNRVEARIALGESSSEWNLHFTDNAGGLASFYFLNNGFQIRYDNTTATINVADMTSFHTYAAHVHNGQVLYLFDGDIVGMGSAIQADANILLVGDDSGSTPTGYGSMRLDYLTINTAAGVIPEPSSTVLVMLAGSMAVMRRKRA